MDPRRVVTIVQARMSSTRLPGKVLMPLAGAPAIVRMIERVRRVTRATRHVVATSVDASDDVVAEVCERHGIPCVRGPLTDVLGRVADATPADCDAVVRLTGDCPLVDPALVDRHIEAFAAGQPFATYVSNAVERTYPDGLDVEVMSRAILIAADGAAVSDADREHVTPWIQRHATCVAVTQPVDLSAVRWVLDTSDDYAAVAAIYEALYPADAAFDSQSVYRLQIECPSLIRIVGDLELTAAVERMRRLLASERPT